MSLQDLPPVWQSPTMWALGALSLLTLALGVERAFLIWRFRHRVGAARDALLMHLREGTARSAQALNASLPRAAATPVFAAALAQSAPGIGGEVRRLTGASARLLQRRVWWLASSATLSPFVGLLGTVLGIMRAFAALGEHSEGGLAVVGQGVGEALVSTAVGIAVAIEAVLLCNGVQAAIGEAVAECQDAIEEVIERRFEAHADEHAPI